MILRGLLDRSLGNFICIRGFAKMDDLATISKVDESYQRDLIIKHQGGIFKFLQKRETLFFPEVVLSYSSNELPSVLKNFKYTDKNLRISTRTNNYRGSEDARNIDFMQIATINIKQNNKLNPSGYKEIFNRIDGNHRLSVADIKDNDPEIQNIITPFCLLLLLQDINKIMLISF